MRATKLYGDGALGSRGAALLADYQDDPGNRGLLFLDAERMQAHIERVLECGLQAGVHAIGDRANRVVLDALEAAIAAQPGNPGRHRVEHAQILDAADLGRFAGWKSSPPCSPRTRPVTCTGRMTGSVASACGVPMPGALCWTAARGWLLGRIFRSKQVNPMLGIYAAVSRQDLQGWPQGGW